MNNNIVEDCRAVMLIEPSSWEAMDGLFVPNLIKEKVV